MKKLICELFILINLIVLSSCEILFGDNNLNSTKGKDNTDTTNTTSKITSQYWGTWIQMDTGTEYYIDNQNVYKKYSNSKSKLQSGIDGFYLESEEVLRNGNTVYFRKGGKKRSFSVNVSGFSQNHNIYNSSRAATTGDQRISGRRKNKENSDDSETITSEDDNSLDFEGGVADDPQTVTVTDGDDTATVTVDPQYDGENIGSIPIVEPGKYAFKTTYKVTNADAQGFMYGNNLGFYSITLDITNIGQETCETSVYSISWTDPKLSSPDLQKEGNFSSIGPGAAKSITGTFVYGYFDEEYKDVTISISITDSKYGKIWNDFVTIRFYRGWVNFKVNARNFNQSSNAKLNGFLVYPDGRSKRFTVSSGNSSTVSVPWSSKDYYFVLSGANNDTEMCYSFVASEYGTLADLSGVWYIADINAYESNDTIQTATSVLNYTTPVKAYLKNGDIDYYKLNMQSLKCSKGGIEILEYEISDSPSLNYTYNNGDNNINPGETIGMDVEIHNTCGVNVQGVQIEASCDSEYLSFISNCASYGNINAGYYQSYYGSISGYRNTGWYSSTMNNYYISSYAPLKFDISADCPIDTTIPINLKMTDVNGYEWTDSFNIKVVKTGTDLEYSEYEFTDTTSINNEYNNNDNCINPGETIWMDIKIHNKGTSLAKNIQLEANSNSEYITFITNSASYGNIAAGYYQSYYGYKSGFNGSGWYNSTTNNFYVTSYAPLKFNISTDCPIDTVIPINLKITDINGYEWTDSFNIKVVKIGTDLEYSENKFSDSAGSSNNYNNGDGNINPGETIWMDIKIHNKGTSLAKNIQLEANSNSEYIIFTTNSASYGNIAAGYYQSYYGYKVGNGSGWFDSNTNNFYVTSYAPLKFNISTDCPIDTVIPINLKMTDINGYEWSDSFNIKVVKTGTDLEYSENKFSDSKSISSSNNNNDGNINPGETIWMDIKIRNKGTSQAKSIQLEANSNSEYIIFTTNSASYGNIAAGYYQSYYGYKVGNSSGWFDSTTNNFYVTSYAPLKFNISTDCPIDTVIPINLKMTDINGYEWIDSFNIKIVER